MVVFVVGVVLLFQKGLSYLDDYYVVIGGLFGFLLT